MARLVRPLDPIDLDPASAAPHPEEMRGTIRFEAGNASLTISGRTTPAGLVCAGLMMLAVLVPITTALTRRR